MEPLAQIEQHSDCDIALHRIVSSNPEHVEIIAGHYCVSDELSDLSSDGETESLSFKIGASFHKYFKQQGIKSEILLWVNDIGIDSKQREALKEHYEIPSNYQKILSHLNIDENDIKIIFESSSRNKASTLLRKRMKKEPEKFLKYDSSDPKLVRCIPGNQCDLPQASGVTAYAIMGPDQFPLVMKEGPNPKCNLILATLFNASAKNANNLVFLNVFNSIYVERIRLGIHVGSEIFDLNNLFVNLFCDDDECFLYDFDEEVSVS